MATPRASRTAVLVCQGRAVAHGRLAIGRFDDPIAIELLRDGERTPVERARHDAPPEGLVARLDVALLGRQAEAMALRTVAVDDAVRRAANAQLVIVGAGLDARAWRMHELADVDVFEVDHPASQHDKRQRTAMLHPTAQSLHLVPVDLRDGDLGTAMDTAGHQVSRSTTWVLEGVIPYLTVDETAATVAAIAARSAPASTLVMTYQTSSPKGGVGRTLARGVFVLMGRGDPMAGEPRRSSWSPDSVRAVVTDAGLELTEDLALADLASDLGVPDRHVGSSRVAVAVVPPG
jgi:methyltransferase (TIGR00027 family)